MGAEAPDAATLVRAANRALYAAKRLGRDRAVLHHAETLEWEEMKRHSEIGARILEHANLRDIGAWVLAHHERIDGRGYPHGLAGDAIPVEARILAVADAYEAMTAERPYKRALPAAAARDELRRGAGSQFDEDIVAVFLRVVKRDLAPASSDRMRGAPAIIRAWGPGSAASPM